jgi:hypothetical protein
MFDDGLDKGGRYRVYRRGDEKTGKHHNCWYFVLDIEHDHHAVNALLAYAESCREDFPQLRFDLLAKIKQITGKDYSNA